MVLFIFFSFVAAFCFLIYKAVTAKKAKHVSGIAKPVIPDVGFQIAPQNDLREGNPEDYATINTKTGEVIATNKFSEAEFIRSVSIAKKFIATVHPDFQGRLQEFESEELIDDPRYSTIGRDREIYEDSVRIVFDTIRTETAISRMALALECLLRIISATGRLGRLNERNVARLRLIEHIQGLEEILMDAARKEVGHEMIKIKSSKTLATREKRVTAITTKLKELGDHHGIDFSKIPIG